MFSGDARDSKGTRHSDIMIQVDRLLEYSDLVTEIQQSQRPHDTTLGEASKRHVVPIERERERERQVDSAGVFSPCASIDNASAILFLL